MLPVCLYLNHRWHVSRSLSWVTRFGVLLPLTSFAKVVRSARLRLPPSPRISPQAKSAFEVDPATCGESLPPPCFPECARQK